MQNFYATLIQRKPCSFPSRGKNLSLYFLYGFSFYRYLPLIRPPPLHIAKTFPAGTVESTLTGLSTCWLSALPLENKEVCCSLTVFLELSCGLDGTLLREDISIRRALRSLLLRCRCIDLTHSLEPLASASNAQALFGPYVPELLFCTQPSEVPCESGGP
jgi:hypothetical protein